MKKIFLIISFLTFISEAYAQQIEVKGLVLDASTNDPLTGANVVISSAVDSTKITGTITNAIGSFKIESISLSPPIRFRISFIGYKTLDTTLTQNKLKGLLFFKLKEARESLEEIEVRAVQTRVEIKGDTAQYNAAAFKVNQDASANSLLSKLPGVTTQNGQLQAQGEQVRRVLVDGQEFFGDDPNLALQSLPANAVQSVQIYDRQSDQSQFTGFNDGNTEKTINIITRGGIKKATFGRLYTGYGSDDRYQGGGNVNFFRGNERISVVGLANNINQQNFSSEDLVGIAEAGRSGRGRFRRGGGSSNNFIIGQQGGINTTNSFGVNYNNNWGKTFKLNSSYFFNQSNNETDQSLEREIFVEDENNQLYDETGELGTDNSNHRLAVRGEYTIDRNSSIILNSRMSFQNSSSFNDQLGSTIFLNSSDSISTILNSNTNNRDGYNLNNSLLFRHRFEKKGRTISLNISSQANSTDGDQLLNSLNTIIASGRSININQSTIIDNQSNQFGASAYYTEPLGDVGQLFLSYRPSYTLSESQQETFSLDRNTGTNLGIDSTLSSTFDNTTFTQRGGAGFRYRKGRNFNASINLDIVTNTLDGQQTYPFTVDVNKSFVNLLPGASLSFGQRSGFSLRLFYRPSTQLPSVTQLQPLVNNSNPQFLSSGNANLDLQYNHRIFARMSWANAGQGNSIFLFGSATFSNSYLGSSTIVAQSDTTISNGISLSPGSQFSNPVNLEGYQSYALFTTFSRPSSWIKSTINLNLGARYSSLPILLNDELSSTNTITPNASLTLASNISENIDFTLTYSGSYTTARNELQPQLNADFYTGNLVGRWEFLIKNKLVLASNLTYTHNNGLGEDFNQNFTLWNLGIGYKFLKNNAAEVILSLFDVLKANTSVNRTVAETYVEDVQTNIIQQYVMLSFNYNIRAFDAPKKKPGDERRWPRRRGNRRF